MKISLVLPYYERQEAAEKALKLLALTYKGLDFEVVIVDDGSRVPLYIPDEAQSLFIKYVKLPQKSAPKCPCVAWNAGAKAASGEIVVMSCVEMLHYQPVLEQLVAELEKQGPQGYVAAAAFCPEEHLWHARSDVRVPGCVQGASRAFCAALYRDYYLEVGGYDEEFREGAGYEDIDFLKRLAKAGTKFVTRDDLVVTHPKTGATTQWPTGSFERNKALLAAKWPAQSITVCCVNAQNYQGCGVEYVNKLFDMVRRNLSAGYPGKFVCFTDQPEGYEEGVEVRPLPVEGLVGWDNKIALFKEGVFADGERVCFLDLDTLVVGLLDELFQYEGRFAVLRDFWRPAGLGPAVMLWEAGKCNFIWNEYEQAYPELRRGDQEWLENLRASGIFSGIDILQDMLPDFFCSYKRDCQFGPPKGAKVVCFHGEPRPHNCEADWVKAVWKVGGGTAAELLSQTNMTRKQVFDNVRANMRRALPIVRQFKGVRVGQVLIVGGGPSLLEDLPEIKRFAEEGAVVVALNNTAKLLEAEGIHVDWQILIDGRPHNAEYIVNSHASTLVLSSHCDPSMFEAAAKRDVYMMHLALDGIIKVLPKRGKYALVSGGTTVGLIAMSWAYLQGWRRLHLYGYDSSYSDGKHHAYAQPANDTEVTFKAQAGDREFLAAGWMVKQVEEFQRLADTLSSAGVELIVHGDGLLPHVARLMAANIAASEAAQLEIANG